MKHLASLTNPAVIPSEILDGSIEGWSVGSQLSSFSVGLCEPYWPIDVSSGQFRNVIICKHEVFAEGKDLIIQTQLVYPECVDHPTAPLSNQYTIGPATVFLRSLARARRVLV
jgi:hypothetical protein